MNKWCLCLFIVGVTVGGMVSCSESSVSDRQLRSALDQAGENRQELEKVLDHYRKEPLKRKAACYLIANMIYHVGVDEYLESPDGERYPFALENFTTQKMAAKKYCDSLQQVGYTLKSVGLPDIKTLSGDFLIDNIDRAFEVWEKPWARQIGFEDFCRYILPYRSQTEKACPLREEFMKRYLPLVEQAHATTPLEACVVVNDQLQKDIRYFATGSPFYPSIEETQRSGVSRCEGLAAYGAFAMRAVGIPVTIDFTIWPKVALGHVWCAVLNNDGRFYDFSPAYAYDPAKRLAWYREKKLRVPAKVYRMEFGRNSDASLRSSGYVTNFEGPTVHDVTTLYPFPVWSLQIELLPEFAQAEGPAYLCVFNRHKWIPLVRGECRNGRATMADVVGDNVFIIADSPDGKTLRTISAPFFVDTLGQTRYFNADLSARDTVVLQKTRVSDHPLSYWDDRRQCFEELGEPDSVTDTTYIYRNLPHNALFLYAFPPHFWHDARIFFVEQANPCIY